jgi:conjugal transfer pilus assembly protein TraW
MASLVKTLLLTFICSSVLAKDFGTVSKAFSIQEVSLSSYLKEKLLSVSQEDLEKFQKRLQVGYTNAIIYPTSLELPEAKEQKVHYFDPTTCLYKDILDSKGNILLKKGQCINPLKDIPGMQTWDVELLIFDGNSKDHVQWAKSQQKDAKWVLVSGSPTVLEEEESRAVYFDQRGILTKKLKITSIPAKINRDGLILKITETPIIKELKNE